MATIVKSEVQVQHRFSILEDDGQTEYTDAIYYPPDVFAKMDQAALDTDAHARFADVLAARTQVAAENAAQAVVASVNPMSADDQRAAMVDSLKATAQALAEQTAAFNEQVKAL